jgi:hypothetical protein
MGFEARGVIEGFYGPPWSHADRVHILEWMAAHGMNVYVYAPKDDPWQRASWREPYPRARMAQIRTEIAVPDVEWVANLSPGRAAIPGRPAPDGPSSDLCFSSDAGAVVAKLAPFCEAGARRVMVSFDDVRKVLTAAEDTRAYGEGDEAFGRANADILNAVVQRLGIPLVTVLADYAGTDDTAYLRGVRDAGLDERIEVMWTGTAVVAPSVTADQASAYAELVGRDRVWLWDNYPVNDFHGNGFGFPTRLYLGPYGGRAPNLDRAVSGVLANPMLEPRASVIALGTVAAYLADPPGYDPERAWSASIADLAGDDRELGDALTVLAENTRSNAFDACESVAFDRAARAALDGDGGALRTELAREACAPAVLRAKLDPSFAAEIEPWLVRMEKNVRAAEAALDLLEAICGRPDLGAVLLRFAILQRAQAASLADRHTMHGDRLAHEFTAVRVNANVVDAFVAAVAERAGEIFPTLSL